MPSARTSSAPASDHVEVAASTPAGNVILSVSDDLSSGHNAFLDESSLSTEIYLPLMESSDQSTFVMDHPVVSPANTTQVGGKEASSGDSGSKVWSSPALPEHPNETSMDISCPDVKRPPFGSIGSDSMHQENKDARLKRIRTRSPCDYSLRARSLSILCIFFTLMGTCFFFLFFLCFFCFASSLYMLRDFSPQTNSGKPCSWCKRRSVAFCFSKKQFFLLN